MADKQISKKIKFTHNSFSPMIASLKRYIRYWVCPDMNNIFVGSANKAIQMLHQYKQDPEIQKRGSLSPFMFLDFKLVEPVVNTDWAWKHVNGAPFLASRVFKPVIYQDNNILQIIPLRMSGRVDFNIFADSSLEASDLMMEFIDGFRGIGHWINLPEIKQFVVVSNEIILHKSSGGEETIRWIDTSVGEFFYRSINKEKVYIPVDTVPVIKMDSITDSSQYLGGEGLPNYSLSGSFTYEIEIPKMINMLTQAYVKDVEVDVDVGLVTEEDKEDKPGGKEIVVVDPGDEEGDIPANVEDKEEKEIVNPNKPGEDKKDIIIESPVIKNCQHLLLVMLEGRDVKWQQIAEDKIVITDYPNFTNENLMLQIFCLKPKECRSKHKNINL